MTSVASLIIITAILVGTLVITKHMYQLREDVDNLEKYLLEQYKSSGDQQEPKSSFPVRRPAQQRSAPVQPYAAPAKQIDNGADACADDINLCDVPLLGLKG